MADQFNTLDNQAAVEPFQITLGRDSAQTADGRNYFATKLQLALANNASQEYLLKVGAQQIGIGFSAVVEGKADFRVFEGTTVSADGTSVPVLNSDRDSPNVAVSTFFDSPTVTADGQLLAEGLLQAAETDEGPAQVQTEGSGRIFLKASTNYLIRITNRSGGAIDNSIVIDFNEPA